MMNSRERLLCLLKGGTPDRVPISPFVQEEYLSYYFHKKDSDRLLDAVPLAEELDFDLITKQFIITEPFFMTHAANQWQVEATTEIRNGNYYKTTKIVTPERTLTHSMAAPYKEDIMGGVHLSTIEYLIKDSDDFAAFKKYMPWPDASYRKYILEAGKFARQYIGNRGINSPWSLGSVYNLVSTYIKVEDMMMDALSDEAYYEDYMNFFTDIVVRDHEIFAESEYDCVGLQGNIANGSMMGNEYFSTYVMPYEKKTLEVLHDAEMPTIYHNCGKAKFLYPAYKELGITVWETLAAAPQGDNDLAEAKQYFGDELILSGNFDQVQFLKTATPKEIEERAIAQMQIGKQGGHYIFSTSDYLEVGTPLENVKALLSAARSVANY